jgi:type 1 glutamine amidotransferase
MQRRKFLVSSIGTGIGLGLGTIDLLAQGQPSVPASTPPPSDPIQSTSRDSGPVADPWPGRKKLLFVADVQTGYHHDAINHTMGVVEELGRRSGAFITFLRTDSQLITKKPIAPQGKYAPSQNINVKTLDYFDAVFLLPAGNGTMNDEQKNALLSFVHDDGKGLIVGHASGNAFIDKGGVSVWPEWNNLIGGKMKGEFHATCRVIVEDPKFPGAMAWGKTSFMFEEQHANFSAPYSREIDHVILRLDPATVPEQYRSQHPDGDIPVAFARQYGKGRVFNIGWGEFESTWDDPGLQKFILGAIQWALGSVPADVTPRPMPKEVAAKI